MQTERREKAYALAARLHQFNITAEEAGRMTKENWQQLATVTRTNAPSAETVKLALEALRSMESVPSMSVAECFRRCKA